MRNTSKNGLPETQVWWEKRRTPLVATVLLRLRTILLLFSEILSQISSQLRFNITIR